jgi:hypothetical protein
VDSCLKFCVSVLMLPTTTRVFPINSFQTEFKFGLISTYLLLLTAFQLTPAFSHRPLVNKYVVRRITLLMPCLETDWLEMRHWRLSPGANYLGLRSSAGSRVNNEFCLGISGGKLCLGRDSHAALGGIGRQCHASSLGLSSRMVRPKSFSVSSEHTLSSFPPFFSRGTKPLCQHEFANMRHASLPLSDFKARARSASDAYVQCISSYQATAVPSTMCVASSKPLYPGLIWLTCCAGSRQALACSRACS